MVKARIIFKTLFYGVFALICFAQVYLILQSFLQYPLVIDMYNTTPDLVGMLPGITICNNNRLSLKKLVKRNSVIRDAIAERYPDWVQSGIPFPNQKRFNSFRDELAKIYEAVNYSAQEELERTSMSGMFELKPDPWSFIRLLDCASTLNESIECNELSQIVTLQDRICTTLFHKGALIYDSVNGPSKFKSNDINTEAGGRNYSYFDSKEMVRVMVDFQPEDYGDLKRQLGARVIFHSNKYIATTSDIDHFITRGYKYDVNIDRSDTVMLDKPYGNCFNYEDFYLDKYKTKLDPRTPLHTDGCYHSCIVRNVIHKAKCWPQGMPYYLNDTLDPNGDLEACDWIKDPRTNSPLYTEMMRVENLKEERLKYGNKTRPQQAVNSQLSDGENNQNGRAYFMKVRRFCWSQCALSCQLSHYSVTVTRSNWPSDMRIIFDKSDQKERLLRHCCALLSIRYSNIAHTVQEFKPKYNLEDTFGNVGGLLAVWLGLSMVSIYRAIEKLTEFLHQRALSKKNVDHRAVSHTSDHWLAYKPEKTAAIASSSATTFNFRLHSSRRSMGGVERKSNSLSEAVDEYERQLKSIPARSFI